MACPFKNLLPAKRTADNASEDKGEVSKCPFSSLLRAQSSGLPSDLDLGAKAAAGGEKAEPATPAVCPYGFSSNSRPKLSALHCILCRALLHKPVRVNSCAHVFCSYCIQPFKDCPACGCDVDVVEEDLATQELVDAFLAAHGGPGSSASKAESSGVRDESSGGRTDGTSDNTSGLQGESSTGSMHYASDRTASTFLLQLGLQSSAGGNFHAALERLAMCRDILIQESQQHSVSVDSGTRSTATSSGEHEPSARYFAGRLGAVYGSQGDCCRKMGDMGKAIGFYRQSSECMRPYADDDNEVAQSLSVTINKLGDVKYMCDDVAGAKECYTEALTLRRKLQQKKKTTGAGADAQARPSVVAEVLDVASSLIKVADATSAMGSQADSQDLFLEAQQTLCELQRTCGWSAADAPSDMCRSQTKCQGLLDLIAQQLDAPAPAQ